MTRLMILFQMRFDFTFVLSSQSLSYALT